MFVEADLSFFFSKKWCFCIFMHEVKPGQAPSISFGNSFCRKDLSLLRSKRQTWGSINILLKLGSRRPTLVLIQMHPAAAAARRQRLVFRKMGFGSILFRVISVQKAFSPFRTLLRIKVKSKAKLSRSDKSSFLFTLTFGNKLQNGVWEGKFLKESLVNNFAKLWRSASRVSFRSKKFGPN